MSKNPINNINTDTLKKYYDNGYIPVLCKGYIYKYNPNKDYKTSKMPIESNFTKPDFQYKVLNEVINHLNIDGNVGWLLPENVIALDIEDLDTIEQVFRLIKNSGLHNNTGIHKTKNGYHFVFKTKKGKNYSANTNVLLKLGRQCTYRIGKKNYLILEPWENRKWENFVDTDQLAELPDLLKPIDANKTLLWENFLIYYYPIY